MRACRWCGEKNSDEAKICGKCLHFQNSFMFLLSSFSAPISLVVSIIAVFVAAWQARISEDDLAEAEYIFRQIEQTKESVSELGITVSEFGVEVENRIGIFRGEINGLKSQLDALDSEYYKSTSKLIDHLATIQSRIDSSDEKSNENYIKLLEANIAGAEASLDGVNEQIESASSKLPGHVELESSYLDLRFSVRCSGSKAVFESTASTPLKNGLEKICPLLRDALLKASGYRDICGEIHGLNKKKIGLNKLLKRYSEELGQQRGL